MELALMNWRQVEDYLRRKDSCVIPIGSTEQHGPGGICGTDHVIPHALALRAGEITGTVVAPPICYGMSDHHLGFPGTVSLRSSTLELVVRDVVSSLYRHGFRRFLFYNGHGGNIAPVNSALSEVSHECKEARFHLKNWWIEPAVVNYADEHFAGKEGFHATPSEISATMALFPGKVPKSKPEPVAPKGKEWPVSPEMYRRQYPNGSIAADGSLADPSHGENLLRIAIDALADFLKEWEK